MATLFPGGNWPPLATSLPRYDIDSEIAVPSGTRTFKWRSTPALVPPNITAIAAKT